jgi:hypothetical protein
LHGNIALDVDAEPLGMEVDAGDQGAELVSQPDDVWDDAWVFSDAEEEPLLFYEVFIQLLNYARHH